MQKPKKHYYIIYEGAMVGETWAVSPAKARVNFWWKYIKGGYPEAPRSNDPEDFDVVEADSKKKY